MKASLYNSALPCCDLGEGPVWDAMSKKLYWVDITGQAIHCLHPGTGIHEHCKTPSMTGFAVPANDGSIITGLQDGIYSLNFSDGGTRLAVRPDGMPLFNRFNDGKCDRRGRLWGGTMNIDPDHPDATGSLYRYDERGLIEFEKNIFISNGLGWSPDNKIMYYTDTVRRVIWQYDYDIETGTPDNRRVFLQATGQGRPDGMCVDRQGRVVTALWPGWGVEIYAPDGNLEDKIELPVPQVSSCAFGGDDFKTLFITTAKVGMTESRLREAPLSGQLFAIELDIAGLPEIPFKSPESS